MFELRRITVVRIRRPPQQTLNDELQWLGNSLGLFGLRDKDRSAFRVFIELLKAAKAGVSLSSDELSYRLGLTRGTVVHHINNLMKAGIVVSEANRYALRDSHLEFVIDELRKDLEREMDELKRAAREIDGMM